MQKDKIKLTIPLKRANQSNMEQIRLVRWQETNQRGNMEDSDTSLI